VAVPALTELRPDSKGDRRDAQHAEVRVWLKKKYTENGKTEASFW
jgi:hypothetical protein